MAGNGNTIEGTHERCLDIWVKRETLKLLGFIPVFWKERKHYLAKYNPGLEGQANQEFLPIDEEHLTAELPHKTVKNGGADYRNILVRIHSREREGALEESIRKYAAGQGVQFKIHYLSG